MKVSARNVFNGTVASLQEGAVNAEVKVALGGGDQLTAIVTMDSAHSLELAPGKAVMALIKAPWVMLMTEHADIRLSARNCLTGTVKTVEMGAVNAEVTLTLAGGAEIYSVVTKEAVSELGLKPGTSATAVIKASNVILGVPA